jgi:hypothetical protein
LKCPETGREATSYPIRHLKNRHFIDLNADRQALPLQPTFFGTIAGAVAGAAASVATTAVTQTAGKLISTMNMDRFRYLLPSSALNRLVSTFGLYLPNALDLEVNEVEVKVLTSLASVTVSTVQDCSEQSTALEFV